MTYVEKMAREIYKKGHFNRPNAKSLEVAKEIIGQVIIDTRKTWVDDIFGKGEK